MRILKLNRDSPHRELLGWLVSMGAVQICFRKVPFKRKLLEDELTTVLVEIEMRVTVALDDINCPHPLTPHLVNYSRLELIEPTVYHLGSEGLNSRYVLYISNILKA